MTVINLPGTSPGRRFATILARREITKFNPEKRLIKLLPKKSGRASSGSISMRHQGGREKRFLRTIDWRRSKRNTKGIVEGIEYDPNRSANIALIKYEDGERQYIIAPEGLKVGSDIVAGDKVEVKLGNAMPLENIPVGTIIHNLELLPGKGAQLIRSAGSSASILAKEGETYQVKFPSGEIHLISKKCYATIGQVSNIDWKNIKFGKAGRKRHLGIRPTVRGVAQDPDSHPHGGGEGRSGIGMPSPKTPWGKKTLGKKTRKEGKYSDKLIIQRRK